MQLKPSFIRKYTRKLNKNIISPIISKTSFVIKLAAIVATPAIVLLSAETGANVARQCFGGLLIQWH